MYIIGVLWTGGRPHAKAAQPGWLYWAG